MAGGGGGGAAPLDRLIARQRSTGHDGNLDETLYYVQNSRGDVVALLRPIDGPDVEPPSIIIGGEGGERGISAMTSPTPSKPSACHHQAAASSRRPVVPDGWRRMIALCVSL